MFVCFLTIQNTISKKQQYNYLQINRFTKKQGDR